MIRFNVFPFQGRPSGVITSSNPDPKYAHMHETLKSIIGITIYRKIEFIASLISSVYGKRLHNPGAMKFDILNTQKAITDILIKTKLPFSTTKRKLCEESSSQGIGSGITLTKQKGEKKL